MNEQESYLPLIPTKNNISRKKCSDRSMVVQLHSLLENVTEPPENERTRELIGKLHFQCIMHRPVLIASGWTWRPCSAWPAGSRPAPVSWT